MSTPFDKMEAERRRSLHEAEQVERDMRDLERIVQRYKLYVVADPGSFVPAPVDYRPSGVREEAEAVIRARGHPLQVNEIAERLLERGVDIGLPGETRVVTANLLKNQNLKYYPKLGWWLSHVSWPPKPEELEFICKAPPQEEQRKRGRRSPQKEQLYHKLRELLEGKSEPTPFGQIFDFIKKSGVTIGGTNEKGNLSVFMNSVHEFRSHGPGGKGGWSFVKDETWSFKDGFKGKEVNDPTWRHNPLQAKIVETLREIMKDRNGLVQMSELYDLLKARGVEFTGIKAPKNELAYLGRVLRAVPCFENQKRRGWRYLAGLDDRQDGGQNQPL
jgi:hypothetical protein